MNPIQAEHMIYEYYRKTNPTEEDTFLYLDALDYLIREVKDDKAMVELGGYYYDARQFDLALKYYEMAAEYDNLYAISSLGYVWYYGRTGTIDYEKAFHYFSRAKEMGDRIAAYKIADMYKNGYFVEKDFDRYKEIVEVLYEEIKDNEWDAQECLPEVYTRLAGIRSKEGKSEEALQLYDRARDVLAQRIQRNAFWGNLNIMKWMIEDIYKLRPFDPTNFGLYDLYYLLQQPVRVRFSFEGKKHEVEMVEEIGGIAIRMDERWVQSIDDFFQKMELEGERLTTLYEELTDWEVLTNG